MPIRAIFEAPPARMVGLRLSRQLLLPDDAAKRILAFLPPSHVRTPACILRTRIPPFRDRESRSGFCNATDFATDSDARAAQRPAPRRLNAPARRRAAVHGRRRVAQLPRGPRP